MPITKRLLLSISVSIIIVIALFTLLASLTQTKNEFAKKGGPSKAFDFIRHQEDSDLMNRSRRKPKPPKEKLPPPTPKLNIAQDIPKPQLSAQSIQMPELALSHQFKGDLLVGANVGSLSMEVIPLVRVAPIYPKRALRTRQEGSVTLRFIINPDGTVRNVSVKNSKPKRIFDAAAIRAIKRWKFKPKLQNGKAVSQQGEQTIIFSLQGNR